MDSIVYGNEAHLMRNPTIKNETLNSMEKCQFLCKNNISSMV